MVPREMVSVPFPLISPEDQKRGKWDVLFLAMELGMNYWAVSVGDEALE